MASDHSITILVQRLKERDELAIDDLWKRYFDKLVDAARRRLGSNPRRVVDEEDVAVSVFASLWRGVERGRFLQLDDRNDLWQILLGITKQKVVNEIRRNRAQKRGGGNVRGDSVFGDRDEQGGGWDVVAGDAPDPAFLAALNEDFDNLLKRLPEESLRDVVHWKMGGDTNQEIADKLGLGLRSVDRKLRIIKQCWSKVLEQ